MITYYSTNNPSDRVNFETALLSGQPKDYGLYMIARNEIPKFARSKIIHMQNKSYSKIAFEVLKPYLSSEIPATKLEALLEDAYGEDKIPTEVKHVTGNTYIMWLTQGPTYSFKDYAARFFGRTLNYFLEKRKLQRTVIVATSGDTGGAIADALYGLDNVENIVFFPKNSISEGQRRQMTTLKGNIYAFEVNGDFDVCQALAKYLLGDKKFAEEVYEDSERFTSANSISIGRLLPQAVYPFFAYSRVADGEPIIVSIPSGNFGDMMGTVIAKEMGLPISKKIVGVNENTEFPDFLRTGKYLVMPSKKSPSSAMIVSHPSNLARLIDFYGGHMFDERDSVSKKVLREGIIDRMPDLKEMRKNIFSIGVNNPQHYKTIKKVYEQHKIILDPHSAVAWKAMEKYNSTIPTIINIIKRLFQDLSEQPIVIYETADPGKFPEDVQRAIGIIPNLPHRMKIQAQLEERIYFIESEPDIINGALKLSERQIREIKSKIKEIASI
jgi:threonine synthase